MTSLDRNKLQLPDEKCLATRPLTPYEAFAVFIAIIVFLYFLKAEKDGKPDNIDIKGMLLHLRSYRVGLVQTPEQLRFSYVAIIQGIVGLFPEAFQVEESENEGKCTRPRLHING